MAPDLDSIGYKKEEKKNSKPEYKPEIEEKKNPRQEVKHDKVKIYEITLNNGKKLITQNVNINNVKDKLMNSMFADSAGGGFIQEVIRGIDNDIVKVMGGEFLQIPKNSVAVPFLVLHKNLTTKETKEWFENKNFKSKKRRFFTFGWIKTNFIFFLFCSKNIFRKKFL